MKNPLIFYFLCKTLKDVNMYYKIDEKIVLRV